MIESYGLDTRFGKAVAAQVIVNDVVVGEMQAGSNSFQSLAIQQEVVNGRNRLDVLLAIAPGHTPPLLGDPDAMFAEMFLELDETRDLGDRYEITTTQIETRKWRAVAGEPVTPQQHIAMEWVAKLTTPDPIWTRATPVGPEEAADLIIAELNQLRALLIDRRLDEFQAHMRIRNEDMARAYPITGSAAKHAGADTAMLDRLLPPAPIAVAPVQRDRLRLRPLAGGRMVACAYDDGHPPLRCDVPGGDPIYINASFAMIDGRMTVVR